MLAKVMLLKLRIRGYKWQFVRTRAGMPPPMPGPGAMPAQYGGGPADIAALNAHMQHMHMQPQMPIGITAYPPQLQPGVSSRC